jgi:hypothetical protein
MDGNRAWQQTGQLRAYPISPQLDQPILTKKRVPRKTAWRARFGIVGGKLKDEISSLASFVGWSPSDVLSDLYRWRRQDRPAGPAVDRGLTG